MLIRICVCLYHGFRAITLPLRVSGTSFTRARCSPPRLPLVPGRRHNILCPRTHRLTIPARPMHRGPTLLAKSHQEKVSREVASGYFFSRETHTSSRVTTVRDWRCQLRAGGRGTGGNGGNGGNSGRCPGVNRTYVAGVVIVLRCNLRPHKF